MIQVVNVVVWLNPDLGCAANMYNDECVIASDKKCADVSLKMYQKRLVAWLHPDPPGDFIALTQTPKLDVTGRGRE